LREHSINSNGAQEGALSGHVRAADDHQTKVAVETQIILHSAAFRNQGMGKSLRVKAGGVFCELREHVRKMFVRIACQRGQSFYFADGGNPAAHGGTKPFAPGLNGKS
jgi:hypothetical protein